MPGNMHAYGFLTILTLKITILVGVLDISYWTPDLDIPLEYDCYRSEKICERQ